MPHLSRHPRPPSDESYVAHLARGKIYREFRSADPNLRYCVAHANMLDRINDSAVQAAMQKRSRRVQAPPSKIQTSSNPRIRDISDEYACLKPQAEHIEDAGLSSEGNLSLSNHFNIVGSGSKETTSVTVSVVSIEVDEGDDSDEFGPSPRPTKHTRPASYSELHHGPPLLVAAGKDESPATGLLATLSVSEGLSAVEWEEG